MARLIASALAVLFVASTSTANAAPDCTVVLFTANWCQPCQQMAPALDRLTSEGWSIRRIDTDLEPHLAKRFEVQSLPTIVILRDGQQVDRIVGAVGYEQLKKRFASAAAGATGASATPGMGAAPVMQPLGGTAAGAPPAQAPAGSASGSGPFPLLGAHSANPPHTSAVPAGAVPAGAVPAGQALAGVQPAAYTEAQAPRATQPAVPTHAVGTSHPGLSPAEAIARAADATVRIRITEGNTVAFGTGTVIHTREGEALVLTCGHMFRDMTAGSQLTVDLFRGGQPLTLPAQLIDFQAQELDIGLISFHAPFAIQPVQLAPLSEPPQVGQPVFSFGCDRGADPSRRDTQIKRLNRFLGPPNIEIAGAPVLGRSGGGLFDTHGRLIGVCNAADEEDDEGIYAAAGVIQAQLKRLGMESLLEAPSGSAAGTLLASAHAPAVNPAAQPGSVSPANTANPASGPANTAARGPANTAARGAAPQRWPDELAEAGLLDTQTALVQGALNAAPRQQLICILRDAQGVQRVIEVDQPSQELVRTLEQYNLSNQTAAAPTAAGWMR
jgi:thiol-disulfide isomerase/thioredoxin